MSVITNRANEFVEALRLAGFMKPESTGTAWIYELYRGAGADIPRWLMRNVELGLLTAACHLTGLTAGMDPRKGVLHAVFRSDSGRIRTREFDKDPELWGANFAQDLSDSYTPEFLDLLIEVAVEQLAMAKGLRTHPFSKGWGDVPELYWNSQAGIGTLKKHIARRFGVGEFTAAAGEPLERTVDFLAQFATFDKARLDLEEGLAIDIQRALAREAAEAKAAEERRLNAIKIREEWEAKQRELAQKALDDELARLDDIAAAQW